MDADKVRAGKTRFPARYQSWSMAESLLGEVRLQEGDLAVLDVLGEMGAHVRCHPGGALGRLRRDEMP